jgi:hypothetical protein
MLIEQRENFLLDRFVHLACSTVACTLAASGCEALIHIKGRGRAGCSEI